MEVSFEGCPAGATTSVAAADDGHGDSDNHQYGDLIRSLLMTSCSAPPLPFLPPPQPTSTDLFRHAHHRYAVNADGTPHVISEPPSPPSSSRPSVVVATLGGVHQSSTASWFKVKKDVVAMEEDGGPCGPPSVEILSPPPSPATNDDVHMDAATRLQIDEFEELIEKIDRLNDMQDVGESRLKSTATLSLADLLASPASSDGGGDDNQDSATSATTGATVGAPPSIDNDLETLLKENPSLLDIPGPCTVTTTSREPVDTAALTAALQSGVQHQTVVPAAAADLMEGEVDDRPNPVLTSPVPTRFFGPPTSLKSATMTTRTNLKQLLQMQQFHEMERKEQSNTSTVGTGPTTVSTSVSVPMQPILPSRMEVPSEVLKVHSRLENPTRYHVEENQKRQVKQYLSTTQGNARSILVHSVPNADAPVSTTASSAKIAVGCISSSAPSPDSPNSVLLSSSAATSVASEADVIESIMQLESSMDVEHAYLSQTSTTQPTSTNFMDVLKLNNSANSCPADVVPLDSLYVTDNQLHAIAKDRQKKDNHNMIERRRRFNINDRIKELGTLLPRSNDPYYDMIRVDRQNKGTILKATVDYVKQMKRELERMKLELTEKDHENRKLRLQNVIRSRHASSGSVGGNAPSPQFGASQHGNDQQLSAMHSHSSSSSGVDVNWSEPPTTARSSPGAVYRPKDERRIKEEPVDVAVGSCDHHLLSQQMSPYDDLMDEDEPAVQNDPMLSSSMLGNTI